jgi:hypothetical protein
VTAPETPEERAAFAAVTDTPGKKQHAESELWDLLAKSAAENGRLAHRVRRAESKHDADAKRIAELEAEVEAGLTAAREGFVNVWLAKRNDELTAAVTVAVELIDRLAWDDPCDVDHNNLCQAHSLHHAPCPHPLGHQFVETWRTAQADGSPS